METIIFDIDPENIPAKDIEQAAEMIKKGGLVAFPTETVYGLGANGLDEDAVKKIFIAKGRPQDNPLILHISDLSQVKQLARNVPENATKLMEHFWPGPLALILKKKDAVPDIITGGLNSVAIRMPRNAIALELIRASGCPLAAPSANLSGKPSPTRAKYVIDDLNGRIDAIIDGGKVDIGIESTVIDMTGDVPHILRPGKITKKQIEEVIGNIGDAKLSSDKPKAPGMKYRHYSPEAKICIVEDEASQKAIQEKYPNKRIRILKYENEISMAKNLFKDLRESDKEGYDIIIVWEVEDIEFGSAIMDRLRKAADSWKDL